MDGRCSLHPSHFLSYTPICKTSIFPIKCHPETSINKEEGGPEVTRFHQLSPLQSSVNYSLMEMAFSASVLDLVKISPPQIPNPCSSLCCKAPSQHLPVCLANSSTLNIYLFILLFIYFGFAGSELWHAGSFSCSMRAS